MRGGPERRPNPGPATRRNGGLISVSRPDRLRRFSIRPRGPEQGSGTHTNAPMTTATWTTMLVILGFVWGGFSLALLTAVRKESGKGE